MRNNWHKDPKDNHVIIQSNCQATEDKEQKGHNKCK